jgi:hypothetical protein
MNHGLSYAPEYRAWQTMRLRCLNPENAAYADYGGRGITVCARWLASPANFIADMGSKPSKLHELDRADNDKGYTCGHCPDCVAKGAVANCRWVTRKVNDRNRRSNRMMTYQGETLTAAEWCERLGLSYGAIMKRLGAGQSDEVALSTPVRRKGKNGCNPPKRKREPGELHGNAKFANEVIVQIRGGHAAGRSAHALSRELGVSRTHIKKILDGKVRRDAALVAANTRAEGRAAA